MGYGLDTEDMCMKKLALALLGASMVPTSGIALAQEVAPLPPPQPVPARPLGQISDAEVSRFAVAAMAAQLIQVEDSLDLDQQRSAMAEVLQGIGVEPLRFRQIAAASQRDDALMTRIQTAAQQQVAAARQQQEPQ